MSSQGYDVKEYLLNVLGDHEKAYREITRLSPSEIVRYNELLDHLKLVNKHRGQYGTVEKGKALEDLVSFLIEHSCIFDVYRNVRTSTNEIDELLSLNSKGQMFRMSGFLGFLRGDFLLSECKNYEGKISVTWVGKFFSLLETSSTKIGILFSYNGLSGTGWRSSVGLVKKLFLLKEDIAKKTCILDFNLDDFEQIATGKSFIELVESKIKALQFDTSFAQFISKHPAEEEIIT